MNIKGLVGTGIANEIRSVDRTNRAIRSDETHDRDPNGQQAFEEQKKHDQPMDDEQFAKAIEHLQSLPATKEHKWDVQVVTEGETKYILIVDNLGTVIRRFHELELWSLPSDINDKKGQFLKKSA